jgi:hypothetical protein
MIRRAHTESDWIIEDAHGFAFVGLIKHRKIKKPFLRWSKRSEDAMGFISQTEAKKYVSKHKVNHLGLHVCQRRNAGNQIYD